MRPPEVENPDPGATGGAGSEDPWYVRSFGRDYLDLYRHRDQQEADLGVTLAIRLLNLDPGSTILDLCCGPGRHMRTLQDLGYRPVGLDLSPELLAESRARGVGSPLVRGDMRRLPFRDAAVDAVLSFFTSFGYFQGDEENRKVLLEGNRILRPGGTFLLDFLNRDHVLEHGLHDSREIREGYVVQQERRWNRENDTIDKKITIFRETRTAEARVYLESVKLYSPQRVASFFEEAGLAVESRRGSLAGKPFRRSSPRFIIVGRKTQ